MMIVRVILLVCAASWVLLACGPEPDVAAPPPGEGAPTAAAEPPASFAGTYKVSGFTVEKQSGNQREISGTVIMAQEGDQYTATFNLTTLFPTPDGPLKSEIIGKGEGQVEGRLLRGTATTQIVMASVPGVDTQFAFIPRFVGPRLVSSTAGRLSEDGLLTVEIESQPAEGETYALTRTTVSGVRMAPLPAVGTPRGETTP